METEEIEWTGRGLALRLLPRGVTDYLRGNGSAVYKTACGATLFMKSIREDGRWREVWRAQYKSWTTTWKDSYQDAIDCLESMVK